MADLEAWTDGVAGIGRNPAAVAFDYTVMNYPLDCCHGTPTASVWSWLEVDGLSLSGARWDSPQHEITWQRTPSERVRVSWRWRVDRPDPSVLYLSAETYLEVTAPYAFVGGGWQAVYTWSSPPPLTDWSSYTVTTGASPGITYGTLVLDATTPSGVVSLEFPSGNIAAAVAALAPWGAGWTWPDGPERMGLTWVPPDQTVSDDRITRAEWLCGDVQPPLGVIRFPVEFPTGG